MNGVAAMASMRVAASTLTGELHMDTKDGFKPMPPRMEAIQEAWRHACVSFLSDHPYPWTQRVSNKYFKIFRDFCNTYGSIFHI
jgi:hypothetical protein